MQYTIVAFFVLAIFSCSPNATQTEQAIGEETSSHLKGRRLQVKDSTGIDLRFSFTESFPTEEGMVYQVVSNYNNKNIGFDLVVHKEGELKCTIKSTGEESNNFLEVLQSLYDQPLDTTLTFTEAITADCLPLGGYMDRMNREANASSLIEHKLFFQGRKKQEYAEFYLTIHEQKHWIELKEIDQAYRPAFLKLLTRKAKRENKSLKKARARELAPGKV